MRYLVLDETKRQFPVAILVPYLKKDEMRRAYVDSCGLNPSSVIFFDLLQQGKKTPVAKMKEYCTQLIQYLVKAGVKTVVCADAEYFKVLSKLPKAEANLGYVLDMNFDPQADMKVLYAPNYSNMFSDPPKIKAKIEQAMNALKAYSKGEYNAPGVDIVRYSSYPKTYEEIKFALEALLLKDCDLTCDTEGFDLKFYNSGLGTISFAWNQNEGIAFPIDMAHGNIRIRKLLKDFFRKFQKKMIYHNITFDVTVLIYQLFMRNILDTKGLLEGMSVLLKNWDCTKIISYLATNSCAGNELGLKAQAQEFAGNYAVEEIENIRAIPLADLLRYNLVDTLSTWYVYNKNWPKVVQDNQVSVYNEIFKPAVLDVIQMQLTGMPIDKVQVGKAKAVLERDYNNAMDIIINTPIVAKYVLKRNIDWVAKKNSELKVKRVTLADAKETFNPSSGPQLCELLYEQLKLPVLDLTDSGLPATGGDTLKKLVFKTTDPDLIALLKALIDLKAVEKIITSFIPAMEGAIKGPDGWHYLFGFFNLGGTLSGRMSSNGPNLQNLPATGSKYAKTIKECFRAPKGWIFVGLDFDSLEDRISALTTKDPNKLKVYTDGYDGHSLRAFGYFGDQMPDILDTVASINSIAEKYKPLRQESKAPTFALTYQGTYITLMANCGFSLEKAKMIEKRFNEMYVVSVEYISDKLDQASIDGYVTAAFGLRVRTPRLAQVIRRKGKKMPRQAEAEGRSAGNAMGQSWCLLNNRAASEFMDHVRKSKFCLDIRPCAHIHDAQYYLIRDNMETFRFLNKYLPKAAQWQNHPEIYHDQVKLSGQVFICYPNWAHECSVPNDAPEDVVLSRYNAHLAKLREKGVIHA